MAVGTAPFDIFPTYEEWIKPFEEGENPDMGKLAEPHFGHLPVWLEGNAYFNGANICKHEKTYLEDKSSKVNVEISDSMGTPKLKTNIYKFLKDFENSVITSDTLGVAFEPEQRFENPDGTSITFDQDYFGDHRGIKTIPGPFASAENAKKVLFDHSVSHS